MTEQKPRANDRDPKNESGRVSRSGTSAGISVANDSTAAGADPIPPGGNAPEPREQLERDRRKH